METENSVNKVRAREQHRLSPVYGDRESMWIVRAIIEDLMGWTPTDMVLKGDYVFNTHTVSKIETMVDRVLAGEPVQYVTGKAPFYGMEFKVTPAVLIPRPETAQLVDIIVSQMGNKSDLKVLDCGTGSGCIAIALSRNLPFPQVTAIDMSMTALKVAEENARELKVRVNFENRDMLSMPAGDDSVYDIIVSNPPYIANHERSGMSRNVLDHEPAMALFVPDDDPLRFYKSIASYARHALTDGGRLYFEINPLYATGISELLAGFDDIAITRDSQGALRFASATKPRQ